MAFDFKNLTEDVRRYMEEEVKLDISNALLYYSKYLSPNGKVVYPDLLINSIRRGNEATLAVSLAGCFNSYYEKNKPSGGTTMAKVPYTANISLAEGEFNRFYIRALCRKALATKKKLRIYRARYSENPRPESEEKIGQFIDATKLLNDLRSNPGTDTALGLPPGPNSGLSVEIVE